MSAVAEGGVYQKVLSGLEGLSSCFTHSETAAHMHVLRYLKLLTLLQYWQLFLKKKGDLRRY